MELWIKNQSNNELIKLNERIYVDELLYTNNKRQFSVLMTFANECGFIILGCYDTEDRAKEILTEISRHLKCACYIQIKTGNMKPESAKLRISKIESNIEKNRNMSIFSDNMEIIQRQTDYYEMPQE